MEPPASLVAYDAKPNTPLFRLSRLFRVSPRVPRAPVSGTQPCECGSNTTFSFDGFPSDKETQLDGPSR